MFIKRNCEKKNGKRKKRESLRKERNMEKEKKRVSGVWKKGHEKGVRNESLKKGIEKNCIDALDKGAKQNRRWRLEWLLADMYRYNRG